MRHFPNEVWVDWARGIQRETSRDEIREHLSSGCSECRKSLETWKAVFELTSRDAAYEPPPGVLARARALFAGYAREASPAGRIELATLLFDSFESPLPAGVRNLERATRHLSYRAGTLFIDVRIEEDAASGTTSLVGQLIESADSPSVSLSELPVILRRGRSKVAETTTNRFGEFSFQVDPAGRDSQIAISMADELTVVVPLGARPGRA